jgi:hypothetical protein
MKKISKLIYCLIATCILLVFTNSCSLPEKKSNSSEWLFAPLPDLSKQPLKLNVAHVINHRFTALSNEQIKQVLARTQQLLRQYFDLDVIFEQSQPVSIEKFFSYLPEKIITERSQYIVDAHNINNAVKKQMRSSIYSTLLENEQQQSSVINYAKPYLVNSSQVTNLMELADELVKTLLHRIEYWYQQNAKDGQPVLNDKPYNEWVWWDSMGYGEMPYDVVVTNQLVASIENYGMAVHSSLRGGITGGTMTYSKNSPYKGYVFISAFQLLNDSAMLAKLRNDERYTEQQIIDYVAALLTHELGHLFFHYGHPFNAPACIMNPTPLLKYREWFDGFDMKACKSGNYPMMQPGAVKIDFNPDW